MSGVGEAEVREMKVKLGNLLTECVQPSDWANDVGAQQRMLVVLACANVSVRLYDEYCNVVTNFIDNLKSVDCPGPGVVLVQKQKEALNDAEKRQLLELVHYFKFYLKPCDWEGFHLSGMDKLFLARTCQRLAARLYPEYVAKVAQDKKDINVGFQRAQEHKRTLEKALEDTEKELSGALRKAGELKSELDSAVEAGRSEAEELKRIIDDVINETVKKEKELRTEIAALKNEVDELKKENQCLEKTAKEFEAQERQRMADDCQSLMRTSQVLPGHGGPSKPSKSNLSMILPNCYMINSLCEM